MKKIFFLVLFLPIFTQGQIITTIAGNGTYGFSGDGDLATNAELSYPSAVAVDHSGNVYIVDFERIRKVNTSGIITTIAGTGVSWYNGDGIPATDAELDAPGSVVVDESGNIFIADALNNRIRKINTSGFISTFAGNGTNGESGDGGAATAAELNGPQKITIDNNKNMYIAEACNIIRKVDTFGIITTYAGTGFGCPSGGGFNGDGGPATAAELYGSAGIAIGKGADNTEVVYIADYNNQRVRVVNALGIINTFAGGGTGGLGNGGPATACGFVGPADVATDKLGNVYIADATNSSVRVVTPSGIINTFAGTYTGGYNGDGGPATAAELNHPSGLAVDDSGNVYIDDLTNNRIRKVSRGTTAVNTILSPGNEINIYPNPAKNDLSVSAPFQINTIVITDLLGQLIFQQECNSKKVLINVAAFPAGVYLIKTNNIYISKFVKY